jgi:hypothetical protein
VLINIESQSGWGPHEDMKMSSAPSFGAPGGHIFDVVAQDVKKHVFTDMLAQAACGIGTTHAFADLKVSN